MKERPILFGAPMVRALLDGAKTQTRRVVKDKVPAKYKRLGWSSQAGGPVVPLSFCPYGQPGDRLWVRETFSGPYCMDAFEGRAAVPPSKWGRTSPVWFWADGEPKRGDWTKPKPSIHMPRWASRILLEIVSVRVERLQDISNSDARAEGVDEWGGDEPGDYRGEYRDLWDSINGPGSWDKNPWVWVIEFRKIDQ